MTPEPAQPAESPEARARIAAASVRPNSPWAKAVLAGKRDDDDAVLAALAAINASTARPTERGAVEEYKLPCDVHLPPATVIRAGCDLATLKLAMEADYRPRHFDGHPNKCLPATDQAAEVEARAIITDLLWVIDRSHGHRHVEAAERARAYLAASTQPPKACEVERREAIARALYLRRNPSEYSCNDSYQWRVAQGLDLSGYYADADAVLAALATQPATGRTMGGEVEKLRIALAATKLAARYVATGDGAYDPYSSHIEAIDAIVDAALQNGGE